MYINFLYRCYSHYMCDKLVSQKEKNQNNFLAVTSYGIESENEVITEHVPFHMKSRCATAIYVWEWDKYIFWFTNRMISFIE